VLALGWWSALSARAEDLPRRALFIAGAVLGTFTIHHAAVRSDPSHLAQAIHPTFLALFGALALRGRLPGWLRQGLASVLFVAAGFAAFNHHPSLVHLGRASLVKTELGGSSVRLLPVHADYYARLVRTIESHVGSDEKLFIAPSRPGLYPIFHKRSPSWWIYFFVPEADRAEQEALVAELQDVPWILIVDKGIADREELRFRNSYDRVWAYITTGYERVPTPELEPYHLLFRKRE